MDIEKLKKLHHQMVGTHYVNDGMVQELANAVPGLCREIEQLKAELRNSTMETLIYFIESCIEIWPEFKNNLKENWRDILNQCNNQSNNQPTDKGQ